MNNFKLLIKDILVVSKSTKTSKKKRRIIFSVLLSNLIVFFDILIILTFTNIFTSSISTQNIIAKFVMDKLWLFPIIILLRFLAIYVEKMNVLSLKLKIEENLRTYLIKEIFDKGNYSISDAYFYVNTISNQVASFYGTFATFLGAAFQIIAYSIYLLITNTNEVMVFFLGMLLLVFPTIYLTKLGRKYSHKTYVYGQDISSEIEKVLDNLYLIKIIKYVDKLHNH